MRTVQKIIQKSGGFERLKQGPIRIDNGDHPALVIQYLGKTGLGECDYLRVMRIEEIGEEISRVFEISFESNPDGSYWRAVVWHSEITGETRYVYTPYEVNNGRTLILIDMDEMRLQRDRANAWDENILKLGYLEATPESPQWELFEAS